MLSINKKTTVSFVAIIAFIMFAIVAIPALDADDDTMVLTGAPLTLTADETETYDFLLINTVADQNSEINGWYRGYGNNAVEALAYALDAVGVSYTFDKTASSVYFKNDATIADWTYSWDSSAEDIIGPNMAVWEYGPSGWEMAAMAFGATDGHRFILSHENYINVAGPTAASIGYIPLDESEYYAPYGWIASIWGYGQRSYESLTTFGTMIPEACTADIQTIGSYFVNNYDDPCDFTWTIDNEVSEIDKVVIKEVYQNTSGKESTRYVSLWSALDLSYGFEGFAQDLFQEIGKNNSMGMWRIYDTTNLDNVKIVATWQHKDGNDWAMVKFVIAAGDKIMISGNGELGSVYIRATNADLCAITVGNFLEALAYSMSPEYKFILGNSVTGEQNLNGIYYGYGYTPVAALKDALDDANIPNTIDGTEEAIFFGSGVIADWTTGWDTSATDIYGPNYAIWEYMDGAWELGGTFGTSDARVYMISHENYYTLTGPSATSFGVKMKEDGTYVAPYGWLAVYNAYLQRDITSLTSLYVIDIPDDSNYYADDIADNFCLVYKDPYGYAWIPNEGATEDLAIITESYENSSGTPGTREVYVKTSVNMDMDFLLAVNIINADMAKISGMGTYNIIDTTGICDDAAVYAVGVHKEGRDYTMIKFVVAAGNKIITSGIDGSGTVYIRAETEDQLGKVVNYFFDSLVRAVTANPEVYTIILNNEIVGQDSEINGYYGIIEFTAPRALANILYDEDTPFSFNPYADSVYFKSGQISDWTTSWDSSASDILGANLAIWSYTEDDGWYIGGAFGADLDVSTYLIAHTNYYNPAGQTAQDALITKVDGVYVGPDGWNLDNANWESYAYVFVAPRDLDADPEDVMDTYGPLPVYTITFNTDGGSEIAPARYTVGDLVIAPENPMKAGATFKGWNPELPEFMPANDLTVKAVWEALPGPTMYTITYNTDGGSTIDPQKYAAGATIVPPQDPVKMGATFKGWSPALPSVMPANDLTVKAIWEPFTKNDNTLLYIAIVIIIIIIIAAIAVVMMKKKKK